MANLINGNGYPAVYADQDADWYASIMGNVTSITGVGQQFEATILDAQTIGVADGVIITKEGRRIQLDANQVDTFDIPVGEQGTTNYYIIGYQLVTQEDSSQVAETFVQLMENATDTIEEETFRGGADEVYVSLYRVTQVGLSITSIDLLLPVIPNMQKVNQLESDLTDKASKSDLATRLNWIPVGQQSGTNTLDISGIPNTATEIYVWVQEGGITCNTIIPILALTGIPSSNPSLFGVSGGLAIGSAGFIVTINASETSISLHDCYRDGTDYKSTAMFAVFYR